MGVNRLSMIKLLELIITIVCIVLHWQSGDTRNLETDFITAGTFGGFLIILGSSFLGHVLTSPITKRIDLIFCLVGCAAFVATGALNIKHYENGYNTDARKYGLAKASLAIINGALFLIDSLFTWRGDY